MVVMHHRVHFPADAGAAVPVPASAEALTETELQMIHTALQFAQKGSIKKVERTGSLAEI